jgi:hypothetical protein
MMMHLFANTPGHHWGSFALGILAGIAAAFLSKRFRRKEER